MHLSPSINAEVKRANIYQDVVINTVTCIRDCLLDGTFENPEVRRTMAVFADKLDQAITDSNIHQLKPIETYDHVEMAKLAYATSADYGRQISSIFGQQS